MTNSIRVQSATKYIIEVNDKGETIEFDTSDTSLTSKLMKAFEKIETLSKEYEDKAKIIEHRKDEPLRKMTDKIIITKNQYDNAQLIEKFYIEARKVMDMFLGDGACQKIFGDINYINMFDDLTEQLKPHFEKMGINAEKIKKSAAEKYSPIHKQHRTLK